MLASDVKMEAASQVVHRGAPVKENWLLSPQHAAVESRKGTEGKGKAASFCCLPVS